MFTVAARYYDRHGNQEFMTWRTVHAVPTLAEARKIMLELQLEGCRSGFIECEDTGRTMDSF